MAGKEGGGGEGEGGYKRIWLRIFVKTDLLSKR